MMTMIMTNGKQTDSIVSFRRKLTSLFVVTSWALFLSIAPANKSQPGENCCDDILRLLADLESL